MEQTKLKQQQYSHINHKYCGNVLISNGQRVLVNCIRPIVHFRHLLYRLMQLITILLTLARCGTRQSMYIQS